MNTADATPQGDLRLGSLSNPLLFTGYEPKFDAENDLEFTPIFFPSMTDPQETEPDFTTDIISEDGHRVQQSSSMQEAASTVFTGLNLASPAGFRKPIRRESERESKLRK